MKIYKDRTGEIVNGYRVLGFAHFSEGIRPKPEWTFECSCGHTFVAQHNSVKHGLRSCKPCRTKKKMHDIAGQTFGLLKAIERLRIDDKNRSIWKVECVTCGQFFERKYQDVKASKSCPCRSHLTKHGLADSPTYKTWNAMMMRCTNPNSHRFDRYGGRGIKVCARWHKFEGFLADMGERPDGTSLDRIDNDGNYEPGNCRWATRNQQRRNMPDVNFITYKGQTKTLAEWADEIGINRDTLRFRILRKNWPIEKAFTTPLMRGRRTDIKL